MQIWLMIGLCAVLLALSAGTVFLYLKPYASAQRRNGTLLVLLIELLFCIRLYRTVPLPQTFHSLFLVMAAALCIPLGGLYLRNHYTMHHGVHTFGTVTRVNLKRMRKGKCTIKYCVDYSFYSAYGYPCAMLKDGHEVELWYQREHPNLYCTAPMLKQSAWLFFGTMPLTVALLYLGIWQF